MFEKKPIKNIPVWEVLSKNYSSDYFEGKILIAQKENEKALKVFKNIIEKKDDTYSVLSLFIIIDRDLEKDRSKISKYFDNVLSINSIKKEDLSLLKLKKAIFISQTGKEKEMLDLINPIINSNSVWKAQSIKFLADYYFSIDEFNKADQYYSTLLDLENPDIDNNEIKRKIKMYKK